MAESRFTATPRRLLLLSTALAAVSAAHPGRAEMPQQLAQAETSRQVAVSISAQPLDSALTALADQADLRLVFRSEDVAGVRSAGLSGSFTADEALRRLLAGTGMVWRFTDARTVTLEKVSAEGALQLDPVSVEGQVPAVETGYVTEGSRSYGSRVASIGSKQPVTLREVPQSVSVVTRQRIEDQNMTRLEDAMRKTTGMTVLTNDNGRSSIYARGFELDQYMVDGLPATLSSIVGTQPDLAMFDHIEVLRGPAGLFGGSGEPGGTVNLIRKRARDTFGGSASATVGSWNSYRAEADASTPLVESKAIRARVAAAYQDSESFVDTVDNKGVLGYGTVEFDLTPDTTLSLALSHQKRDITPSNGLPGFTNGNLADVDRSTFIGADWNRFESTATEGFADIEHRFDRGGILKASLRYTDRDSDFKYAFSGGAGINPATNTFTMTSTAREYGEEAWAGDVHLSQPFQMFGQTQTVTGGLDFRRSDQVVRYGNVNIPGAYSLSTFNSAAVPEPATNYSNRLNTVLSQYSAYGQARIKPVAPLTAVLGGRVGNYKVDMDNLVTNTNTTIKDNGEFTPYAGLIWDFHPNLSAYVSHTEIFLPQTSTTAGGKLLDPQTGEQQEVGVKGEFMDGRLNTHLAYYQADIKNRAISNTASPGSSVAGDVRTRGIDAEVSGTLLPGWEVFGGYSYLISEYTDVPKGQTFNTWTPKHTFILWTKYTFGEGQLEGFNVGGGLRAVSGYFGQATGTSPSATRWHQEGYQVFDGQVGYQLTETLDATFTVNNIFDEKYYSRTGGGTTFNLYGEPRSFWLRLGAKF